MFFDDKFLKYKHFPDKQIQAGYTLTFRIFRFVMNYNQAREIMEETGRKAFLEEDVSMFET